MTFVFIVGTGRCGSSLLQEVVSRHSAVGFLSNVDDLVGRVPLRRANNAVYRLVPPSLTAKGRARFAPSEGYRAISRAVSPLVAVPGRPLVGADASPWLSRRFKGFFDEQAAAQRKPVFVHKFTGWSRVGFINAVLPDSRFIHVVRDGRAVANSLVQMPWWRDYRDPMLPEVVPAADMQYWSDNGMSFPLLAGLVWKSVIQSHQVARADIGDRWLELRYEDLLSDPHAVLDRVLKHIGLPADAAFERQLERHAFDGNRSTAYVDQLSATDLKLLEEALDDLLRTFGYPTASSRIMAT